MKVPLARYPSETVDVSPGIGTHRREAKAERAVCLMDIADDWRQQFNLDLYEQTYDAAIAFAREYPGTLWCYGNHDLYVICGIKERLDIPRLRREWFARS